MRITQTTQNCWLAILESNKKAQEEEEEELGIIGRLSSTEIVQAPVTASFPCPINHHHQLRIVDWAMQQTVCDREGLGIKLIIRNCGFHYIIREHQIVKNA
jgi:hypothetical protein